jgi:staphylococcal nuclease domain-containing protein 1
MGSRGAGVVKAVLSGDTIIVQGAPKGGPPPEKQISLNGISAPRLARRDGEDEPFAWASREGLRLTCIGKQVDFQVEKIDPTTLRESGIVTFNGQNLAEYMVAEGLAKVAKGAPQPPANLDELVRREEAAQGQGKGLWNSNQAGAVRKIPPAFDATSAEAYVSKNKGKKVRGVVESFRDAACFRATLLPEYHQATIMLSGLQAPGFKKENGQELAQPFARDAKFFVEARLLNREVDIMIEGCDKYGNLVGMVLHPNGNMSEMLLSNGLARLADWSFGYSTIQAQLKAAEAKARDGRVRIWKDFTPKAAAVGTGEFIGKVVEVVSGEVLIIQDANGSDRKLSLSSIRVPKLGRRDDAPEPYALEAKEAVRSKAIGKKVKVNVEYVREIPPNSGEERGFATVIVENKTNLAKMLIELGYAQCVKHRLAEDTATDYADYQRAEEEAKEKKKGLHNPNAPPARRTTDLSAKDAKAKAQTALVSFQHKGKMRAICDYVINGARMKVYLPKESTILTVALAGVRCPQGSRAGVPGEAYGDEATNFTRELCFQRDLEIEIDSLDRGGAFIASVSINKKDLGVLLLESGLAWISSGIGITSEHEVSENLAKKEEKKVWKGWEEKMQALEAERAEAMAAEGANSGKWSDIAIAEIIDGVTVYVHKATDKLAELETQMATFGSWAASQAANSDYSPKVGDVTAALLADDGKWYRVRIEQRDGEGFFCQFIDYGTRDVIQVADLREPSADSGFPSVDAIPAQATECRLAYCKPPRAEDEELCYESGLKLRELIWEKSVQMAVDYTMNKVEFITLKVEGQDLSVNSQLLQAGLVTVDKKLARRHKGKEAALIADEEVARRSRLNCFEYGEYDSDEDVKWQPKDKAGDKK